MATQDHIYYTMTIRNNSDTENKQVEQTDVRPSPLLEKAEDYKLAVMKFSLPTEGIEAYKITDPSLYQVNIQGMSAAKDLSIATNETVKVFSTITNMNSSAEMPIYSSKDFVENVNRTLQRAHRDYLNAVRNDFGSRVVVTTSFTEATASGSVSATQMYKSFSLLPFSGPSSRLAYSQITLTLSQGDASGRIQDQLFEVLLEDTVGNFVTLVSNVQAPRTGTGTASFQLEDGNVKGVGEAVQYSAGSFISGSFYPMELLAKFNNISQTGTWKLHVRSKNHNPASVTLVNPMKFTCSMTFTAHFAAADINGQCQPCFAPYFTISDSANRLFFNFHQNALRCGISYAFSPLLSQVLGFDSVRQGSFYRLIYPQIVFQPPSVTEEMISFPQTVSSLYKMVSIRNIAFVSQSLSCLGEFNSIAFDGVICSFSPYTDTVKDRYEFIATSEYRYYNMKSSQEVRDIHLQVWIEYNTGERVPAVLTPKSEFSTTLHFVKRPADEGFSRYLAFLAEKIAKRIGVN